MGTASFLHQQPEGGWYFKTPSSDEWWNNMLFVPVILVAASALLLATRLALRTIRDRCSNHVESPVLKGVLAPDGGFVVLAFRTVRFIACVALFGIQFYQLFKSLAISGGDSPWDEIFKKERYPQLALVLTYLYISILSFVAIGTGRLAAVARRHAIIILILTFGVYVYRDIVPWMTYTLEPMDQDEGQILYVKLLLLNIAAIVVPLFIPRIYVPLDPENSMPISNGEQTASLFSLVTYTFLDSVIKEAATVPHLAFDRLPPLIDHESAAHLKEISFPHLDQFRAKKRRHLFWGFMTVFSREYTILALSLVVLSGARFLSPLALNRILDFMENGETADRVMSPWFWVAALFFGPVIGSITWQWYFFLSTRVFVRTQAILTQLVFEHSLRIRFKAETNGKEKANTRPSTPKTVSESGEETEMETEDGRSEATAVSSGKDKANEEVPQEAPSAAKRDNLIGKINTLVSVDVDTILGGREFLMFIIQVPLELTLAAIFLYNILGWSAFVGFASIVVMLPIPGYVGSLIQKSHEGKMAKTEARVEAVTEAIGVLRMVKLFGWEKKMSEYLGEKREDELKWVWKNKLVELANGVVNNLIPTITMVVTYATYAIVMRKTLSASVVFSSMAVFDRIREKLQMSSWIFAQALRGRVSLERLQNFLRETELLDEFDEKASEQLAASSMHLDAARQSVIGFKDAVFTWDSTQSGSKTPSKGFRLQIGGEFTFQKNCINLIVGPTGSGKTSLLMALLGEMHYIPTSMDSWFNLPRGGGVAYAAQESWVQNETIRDNILFGSPYDEERYNKVIYQCALTRDLELFEAGDKTEVGEKGLTLSGGQKARVTLARALYSPAEIILLDDTFAALDVHTSRWIVKECLRGDLIRDRTVLLVTHNVALVGPVAGHFVSVDINGVVTDAGASFVDAFPSLAGLEEAAGGEGETSKEGGSQDADGKTGGKLILPEEIQEGHVAWKSILLFLRAMGGSRPLFFVIVWTMTMASAPAAESFSVWLLGFWSSQYEDKSPQEVNVVFYLTVYVVALLVTQVFYAGNDAYYLLGTLRASRFINNTVVASILTSTFRWLDETPASRILARCTQDIAIIDDDLANNFYGTTVLGFIMVVKLGGAVLFTPIFLVPGLVVMMVGVYLGNLYLKAQLSVKREMSNARAPVLAHFGAAIAGITSIRAYGAQDTFKKHSLSRIDHYTRICKTSYNLNRWVAVRFDFLGNTFTAGLAAFLLIRRSISAANTGFSLIQSMEFCQVIIWAVRSYNDLEVQSNSLERIQAYIDIDHEPQPTETGKPPASWPTSGKLVVDNLSAKYSANGPEVLQNISFSVGSGERVGIVGRTGSGKSSLTLALLRCILVEGNISYDGLPVDKLNLDALRNSVTIIPQVPELLSGTLRRNLDPFDQNDDATLNNALRDAGLFSLQSEMDEGRLTLDSEIASGGGNLSVGQRQIIALARAIVRNSKLLILDEATSAIDHKTDSIIQSTLRTRLASDISVLTVAHRLQTVMDSDKIMVLDAGKIVEYDSPAVLLCKEDGVFKSMVDGSGDKEALYALASVPT